MLSSFLGPKGYKRGVDLYFERHDGEAVTCDDFLAALADANDWIYHYFLCGTVRPVHLS